MSAALQFIGPMVSRMSDDVSSVVVNRLNQYITTSAARGDAYPDGIADMAGSTVRQVSGASLLAGTLDRLTDCSLCNLKRLHAFQKHLQVWQGSIVRQVSRAVLLAADCLPPQDLGSAAKMYLNEQIGLGALL